jgi:hypothetical protein
MNLTRNLGQKKAARSQVLRRLGLIAGFGFLVTAIPLLVVVVPDQVRSVPQPSNPMALFVDEGLLSAAQGADDEVEAAPVGVPSATETASAPQKKVGRKFFIMPDISDWPDDLQVLARRWEQEQTARLESMLTVPVRTKHLTFEEALSELHRVSASYNKEYGRALPAHYSAILGDAVLPVYANIYNEVVHSLYVVREEWDAAAFTCMDRDWDMAVYYWRKDGLRGRALLAVRSLQRTRIYKALENRMLKGGIK